MTEIRPCTHIAPTSHIHGIHPHVISFCPAHTVIACKFCGSKNIIKHGFKKEAQQYLCHDCGRVSTDKDTPEDRQTATPIIAAAMGSFYNGASTTDISREIQNTFKQTICPSTIYRWVIDYSKKAAAYMDTLKANTSETWVVDETVVKVAGVNVWYWDVIDEGTRFLINTHLSDRRAISNVITLFEKCKKRVTKPPHFILSDGMKAYIDGIERVFGADAHHIVSKGITAEINTNLIERFHSTLKERYKVMRGLKTMESAWIILNGFVVNYNFFRPHMTLGNITPAKAAGIKLPFSDWEGFIRYEQSTT